MSKRIVITAKQKAATARRIERELDRYNIFTGEFHPDTADDSRPHDSYVFCGPGLKKQKQEEVNRMKKEVEVYGNFGGAFRPGTAKPVPSLAILIQRILSELRGVKDPALVTILRKQIQKAEAGDVKSATFLFDRAFGMPKQTIEQIGDPVNQIQIKIINHGSEIPPSLRAEGDPQEPQTNGHQPGPQHAVVTKRNYK